MDRNELIEKYEKTILMSACELFSLNKADLSVFSCYEGCANLVYACKRDKEPVILRISYRQDRSLAQIQAELHFVSYLAENGICISKPYPSIHKKTVEVITVGGQPLYLVCFTRGKGVRVPDNGYRYREDAPIEEYFQNWGSVLGKIHWLARHYEPLSPAITRPDWFTLHASQLDLDSRIPQELAETREYIEMLLNDVRALPQELGGYGLIHGDFNDGNFTVDYTNGLFTVFDFDDCCYFWFAYELASAWEGGIGRIMFRGLEERKAFMDHYMEQVYEGYFRENDLYDMWLDKIPLFLRLIQVEEFLYYVQYYHNADEEIQSHLAYLIACINEGLPYLGFFDLIYNPDHPFLL